MTNEIVNEKFTKTQARIVRDARSAMEADPHDDAAVDAYTDAQKTLIGCDDIGRETIREKATVLVELAADVECKVTADFMRRVASDLIALTSSPANTNMSSIDDIIALDF